MSRELFWLTLTVAMTGLMWVPYILDRFATRGNMGTLGYPGPETPPPSAWADRARLAHANAVENLVLFAPLVLAVELTGTSSALTAGACVVYFWARLAHWVVYTLKVPVLRTLAFLVAWGALVALVVSLL